MQIKKRRSWAAGGYAGAVYWLVLAHFDPSHTYIPIRGAYRPAYIGAIASPVFVCKKMKAHGKFGKMGKKI